MLPSTSLPLNALLGTAAQQPAVGFSNTMQFGDWASTNPAAGQSPQATQAIATAWQSQFSQSLGEASASPLTLQAGIEKSKQLPVGGFAQGGSVGELANSFGQALGQQMTELNSLQTNSDQLTQDFASGKGVALHQVMIAMNKADMSMQLAMQVRNKVLGAYQEISRMPV